MNVRAMLILGSLALAMLAGVILAGCDRVDRQVEKSILVEHQYRAAAVLALEEQESVPDPQPTPAPGFCTNCDGKGKLGDGAIVKVCRICGGDGRTDNEPPPVFELDLSALEVLAAQHSTVRAEVLCGPACPPCKKMKQLCPPELEPLGWEFGPDGDIWFRGEGDTDTFPTTRVFVDDKLVQTITEYLSPTALAELLNKHRQAQPAQDYQALRVATIDAKEPIEQLLTEAQRFLGNDGAITLTRSAGEVDCGQVAVTFPAATTITAKLSQGSLVVRCSPAPRLKIQGVPLLKPAVLGATISRDSIRLDLNRWPSMTIAIQ